MPIGQVASVTQWACQCCLLMMANGECCDSEQHGGDGISPLSKIPEGCDTTLGMFAESHSEGCPNVTPAGHWVGGSDCDCESIEFTWTSCDSCGSALAGSRHAFIVWSPAVA